MIAKLAIVVALIVALATAPAVIPEPDASGYPAPPAATELAPVFSVGDAPTPWPTATPITLPYDCVEAVSLGRACRGYPTSAPLPAGYPKP